MPHLRERCLKIHIEKALKHSPLVGVLGQRQVGKTTLLKSIVASSYVTLDEEEANARAQSKPKTFLVEFSELTAIDECQKAPPLFSALKLRVQECKRPGQFILSGSVRFTSRKAIAESLTGRLLNLELLPMALFETKKLGPLDYLGWFTSKSSALNESLKSRELAISKTHREEYLLKGGLPGICFSREESFRRGMLRSHIETLLQRDIRQIIDTTAPYEALYSLLQYLAIHQGKAFVLKDATNYCRLSQVTVKRIIAAFEGLFLIRRGVGFGFKNSPRFYLEDQGMAHFLSPVQADNRAARWMFSQTFGNIHYRYMNEYQLGYSESKYDLCVPLVYRIRSETLGFLYEDAEAPSPGALKIARDFLNSVENGRLILLGEYKQLSVFSENILLCPWRWIA